MADYKLYDEKNHSVPIDPQLEKEKTFKTIDEAFNYNVSKNLSNYQVIKNTLPSEVRSSIEKNIGPIEYINERDADRGHFAIARNQKGNFDTLQVDSLDKGYRIQIKSGFPDMDQAHKHTMNLQRQDMQQEMRNDISR